MAREIQYLYGDSTPSSLKTDFISFLHDVLDFAVQVMLEEGKAQDAQFHAAQLADRSEREIEHAEKLAGELGAALDREAAPGGDGEREGERDSLTARCAARIRHEVRAVVAAEADALRAAVAGQKGRATQSQASARAACKKTLEALLVRQDLPDAAAAIAVETGEGSPYAAHLHGRTPYGLHWVMSLDIDAPHPLAQPLRVDRVHGRLSVLAPQTVGWFRKRVKLLPQRLDRLYVRALRVDEGATTLQLRRKLEPASAGFDLLFTDDPARVEIVRVVEGGLAPDPAHVVTGDDLAPLAALRAELTAMLGELRAHRHALVEAHLDDTALEHLEAPRMLLERLFASLAPTVQEIARRSLVPGELVLKRVVGDNRREEIFATRAALRGKLEPLPSALRSVFDPLRLWEDEPRVPAGSARPASEGRQLAAVPQSDAPPPLFAVAHPEKAMSTTMPFPVTVPQAVALGALGKAPPHSATSGNGRADSTGKWPALRP